MFKVFNWFILFLLLITSLILSFLYTLNHQDFHHWSFILNSYYDLKNNFDPFNEIYLQYGLGQPFFFLILSKIFSINYLSIGYITALAYAINLLLIYIISKKYLSEHLSLLLIFIIIGLHPYIIYPWPDYLSSLCLTISILIYINSNKVYLIFISALFLSLAYIFRTSYLVNISLFILISIFINYKFIKSKKILYFCKSFISILLVLFFLFYIDKSLYDWIYQGIFSIKDYAYGSNYKHMDKIISIIGDYGWLFLKFSKMFLRLIENLLFTLEFKNLVFTLFLLLNFIFLYSLIREKKPNIDLFLFSVIGLLGFIQSFMIFETFRNINATILMTIPAFYILQKKDNTVFKNIIVLIFVFLSTMNIYINSKKIYNISKNKNYSFNDNSYFSKKKFNSENYNYYKNIYTEICNQKKILINVSYETSLPYFCSINEKKIVSPNFLSWIKLIDINLYDRINRNDLLDNELLITTKNINNLNEIYSINLPEDLSYIGWPDKSKKINFYTKH